LPLAGCGDGGPKIVPVSGKVLIDGQPLGYGYVQVLAEGWRPATSKIGPDGRFVLTTSTEGDGCAVGTHPVVVLAGEPISEEKMKWHAPEKYTKPDSGLTVTITGPTNDLVIELSSAGAKSPSKKTSVENSTELGFKFDK
jgi:hypothetical protein